MTSLLFILLSSLSYASTDSSDLSTSQYAPADKTDKQAWSVSEEDAPQDEVYSQSDVAGTLGLFLSELDTDELDTGSATAHSDVEDSGSSDHFFWIKRAENLHESSWRFTDQGSRGVIWSYVGVSGHEAETVLEGGCEPDDWDINCMVEIHQTLREPNDVCAWLRVPKDGTGIITLRIRYSRLRAPKDGTVLRVALAYVRVGDERVFEAS